MSRMRTTLRTHSCGELRTADVGTEVALCGWVAHRRDYFRDSIQSRLAGAKRAVQGKIPHEMIMIDLYSALRPLDAITGETTADDILNLIFSSFCIGK